VLEQLCYAFSLHSWNSGKSCTVLDWSMAGIVSKIRK